MIFTVGVFLIFVIIPCILMYYSLGKAGEICQKIKVEQPDFFDTKKRYKFLTGVNNTQFIFYILSGKYKYIKNEQLVKICRKVRWLYIISFLLFFAFCSFFVLHDILHP